MKKIFSFCFLTIITFSVAQTDKAYLRHYNMDVLNNLKEEFNADFLIKEARIAEFLKSNPDVPKSYYEGLIFKSMVDVINNEPVYNQTDNVNSAISITANRLYNNGNLSLNVQGQDMMIGIWDGGAMRLTHQEYVGKVVNPDGAAVNSHGTHVGGTAMASGVNSAARGLAFNASAKSYYWDNDLAEMTTEALAGLLVSNHSYGPSSTNIWTLGAYDITARQTDQLVYNAPFYTIFKSAGNDRNNTDSSNIISHLGQKNGYDLIKTWGNAKNIVTVGAVNAVTDYQGPFSVTMSAFSSWGPTDDGRIKPDIVAMGVNLFSSTSASNTSYGFSSGTSMSSPSAAGAALLLQQHYFNTNNAYMRSATLKGLICHTAKEAGFFDGPDYRFGWGLMDTAAAAQTITKATQNQAIVNELVLNNNQTYTLQINASGSTPLMASISWTDPHALNHNNTNTIDPNVLYLVNDLDIRIIKDGVTYFPWTLNPSDPFLPAEKNADNFRDNFEKIEILNPSGTYTIQVTHKGTLRDNLQNFSLIVTADNVTLSTNDNQLEQFSLFPNPTNGLLNINLNNQTESTNLEIVDSLGRIVHKSTLRSSQNTIDVSYLQSGIFFVRLIDSKNNSQTIKFIKK